MPIDETMLDAVRVALMTAIKIAAPMLAAGVAIGLIISIVQSITSIQDQTLTFVPKIFVMLAVAVVLLSWLASRLAAFAAEMFDLTTLLRS
jgi:flagellar biosynthetic protein FliQ